MTENSEKPVRLADAIYSDILENDYLQELYNAILHNYAVKLFGGSTQEYTDFELIDALRFADILSKSAYSNQSEVHKSLAQEMVTLLDYLYPGDEDVEFYAGSVLTNTCNFRGRDLMAPGYKSSSLFEQLYSEVMQEYLEVPGDAEKHFFRSQKEVYDHFDDGSFSYSGPTSMGKSFVMQTFIKNQIELDKGYNFALLVPTIQCLANQRNRVLIQAVLH